MEGRPRRWTRFRISSRRSRARTPLTCTWRALASRGDFQSALEPFRRTIELNPGFAPAHHGLGWALTELGLASRAMESLNTARELAPESAEIRNQMGETLEVLGRSEEALDAYSRAMALDPLLSDAVTRRAALPPGAGALP